MYLGVDGGGTKTAFLLVDDGLMEVDRLVLGTSHHAQAGYGGVRAVLSEGIGWARGRAAELGASLAGIGFGICAYGEDAEAARFLRGLADELSAGTPHVLVNDVDAAWAAGLECADGIAVIAGTGSIAVGVRGSMRVRCGGWDYEIGDEGSGGWMGRRLLRAFTRQADGRDPRGALYGIVRRALGIERDFDIIDFARAHLTDRGRISSLSPLVSEAARAGDASALAIFQQAAREEADLVDAIVRQLFADAPDASVPVTYVGGTFRAGDLILGPLGRALPASTHLVAPLHGPELGPILLLQRGIEVSG